MCVISLTQICRPAQDARVIITIFNSVTRRTKKLLEGKYACSGLDTEITGPEYVLVGVGASGVIMARAEDVCDPILDPSQPRPGRRADRCNQVARQSLGPGREAASRTRSQVGRL